MANINDLNLFLGLVKEKLITSPLFFVVPDTERGFGLEGLIENYFIVTSESDYLAARPGHTNFVRYFSQQLPTGKLILEQEFVDFIKGRSLNSQKIYIQFFKNTSDDAFAQFQQKLGMNAAIINNSASLTRQIENKINQYRLLSAPESGVKENLPETLLLSLKDLNADVIRQQFPEFVVQTAFGHTGEATFVIDQANTDLEKLQKLQAEKPALQVKVTKLITGHPFTINGCIYNGKVYVGGLSYQYTGIVGLTGIKFATVGNDWGLPAQLLKPEVIDNIYQLAEKAGNELIKLGFRGLFGIDLVVNQADQKPYLIEINPRQTLSIAMYTKLQIKQQQIPLSLLNLCEFLDIKQDIDPGTYNQTSKNQPAAAQVFLRNSNEKLQQIPVTMNIKSGIYRQMSDNAARDKIAQGLNNEVVFLDHTEDRPLIWQSDFNNILDFDQEGIGLMLKTTNTPVNYNQELARIQAHRSLGQVQENSVMLLPLVADALKSIKEKFND